MSKDKERLLDHRKIHHGDHDEVLDLGADDDDSQERGRIVDLPRWAQS